eukprot:snap_masked-scaffold_8-processed-gene-2.22-mRNA-1 protein AED:1.00 eAED:1.00 QI:0/0/0/0/1/1/2/0/136
MVTYKLVVNCGVHGGHEAEGEKNLKRFLRSFSEDGAEFLLTLSPVDSSLAATTFIFKERFLGVPFERGLIRYVLRSRKIKGKPLEDINQSEIIKYGRNCLRRWGLVGFYFDKSISGKVTAGSLIFQESLKTKLRNI